MYLPGECSLRIALEMMTTLTITTKIILKKLMIKQQMRS